MDQAFTHPDNRKLRLSVGQMLPQSIVLLGLDATIGQFRALSPGKAYLHVASHGEFNARSPLRSRLLLAPDAGDTGDLTVESLYTLRLDARLVTLSACETTVSLSDARPKDGADNRVRLALCRRGARVCGTAERGGVCSRPPGTGLGPYP